ncbi:MAG: hypothetical protein AAGJ46_21555 [Planctomycetota bacterium]
MTNLQQLIATWLLAAACTCHAQTPADYRVRRCYVQEVAWIAREVQSLRAQGYTERSIAIAAHGLRREIGREYKAITSAGMRQTIAARNLDRYGDAEGPTVTWLRGRGKTWAEIADSAGRVGGEDVIRLQGGLE